VSFLHYLFDSEWSQRSDIERLKAANERSRSNAARRLRRERAKVAGLEDRVDDLEQQVGELALYLKAAIRQLDQRGNVPVEELMRTIETIDAEDGEVDGRTRL